MSNIPYMVAFVVLVLALLSISSMFSDSEPFEDAYGLNAFASGHGRDPEDMYVPTRTEQERLDELRLGVTQLLKYLQAHERDNIVTRDLKLKWNPANLKVLRADGATEAAFTRNKQVIYICLRDVEAEAKRGTRAPDILYDTDASMFVLLHELAHMVTTTEVGHTNTFWENMKFLILNAELAKMPDGRPVFVDPRFENNTIVYCGKPITANPATCVKSGECPFPSTAKVSAH